MDFWAQAAEAAPIIVSLIVIEALLSVDNALAIAALAAPLPPAQRKKVLFLGIAGAYLFRGLALLVASWIIAHMWIKVLGALYLVYLMCAHLTTPPPQDEPGAVKRDQFWPIFWSIQLVDLSLSIDNVVAAVALSNKLWIVCTGVFIGILALRFSVGIFVRLLAKHPILGPTAFLVVGFVGMLLLAEIGFHVEVPSYAKFGGIGAIVGATLAYERYAGVRRVADPLVRIAAWPMNAVRVTVGAVFWPLGWVFRKLVRH
jgi:YkoY family integral membrane protein